MIENNWHKRLQSARDAEKLTQKEASKVIGISEQSLIKYESGVIFPKVDVLELLCSLYHVTISWVLYGDADYSSITKESNYLFLLFGLLHSGKMSQVSLKYDEEARFLKINDKKLSSQINALNIFQKKIPLAGRNDYVLLIHGIEKIFEEYNTKDIL